MSDRTQYRALVGLSIPASAADLRKAVAGEPYLAKRVEVGEISDEIPAISAPWLLRDGKIEEVRGDG